ncbi:hypothetical protein BC936DRAFT_144911 [Jimgerdemannia flammicorona]|uniref:C2H2-type domain-containing protein n=1 Tax=Jimgerdemannia flammicorona TaxID=994334 RepID=A0A433DBC9_9FUNG|nr:hypothetical protein BC936DRAFT_144911 [Jimgerdemannia flammicorona]
MRRSKLTSGNVFDQERTCNVCSVKYNDDRAFETHLAGWAHRRRLASQQGGASVTNGPCSDPATTVRLSREVKSTEQQARTTHLPPLYPLLPGQAANTLDSAATAIIVPAAASAVNLVPPTNLPSATIPPSVTTAAFDPPGPAATKRYQPTSNIRFSHPFTE